MNRAKVEFNHFLFLVVDHIPRIVSECRQHKAASRGSRAIHGFPDPYPEVRKPPPSSHGGFAEYADFSEGHPPERAPIRRCSTTSRRPDEPFAHALSILIC